MKELKYNFLAMGKTFNSANHFLHFSEFHRFSKNFISVLRGRKQFFSPLVKTNIYPLNVGFFLKQKPDIKQ